MASSPNRDEMLKAFVSRGRNRRKKNSMLPPAENVFAAQARTPRITKRGSYRPPKRSQRPGY